MNILCNKKFTKRSRVAQAAGHMQRRVPMAIGQVGIRAILKQPLGLDQLETHNNVLNCAWKTLEMLKKYPPPLGGGGGGGKNWNISL